MGLMESFAEQFKKPHGFWGRLAGFLMAKGAEKSEWTVSLLNPGRADRVLEVGFGPGMAVKALTQKVTEGYIAGIDISELMLETAAKRNKEAIAKGLVELKLADVSQLPSFGEKFDHVISVNSMMFWEDPVKVFENLRSVTKPNGKIAVTVQPRVKGDEDRAVSEFGERIAGYLLKAGYSEIRVHRKPMKPIACVCVTAVNQMRQDP